MEELEKVKIEKTSDMKIAAYNILKKMIMGREFTPNERLDANEIAKKLGISRTPVRDALSMLNNEGFVEIYPRKGIFVTGIYKQDLIQLFQFREMIEVFSLEVGFDKLRKNIATLEDFAKEEGDHMQGVGAYNGSMIMNFDSQIHKFIVGSSQNQKIIKTYDNLNCHVKVARAFYINNIERVKETHIEHLEIIQSIKNENVIEARTKLKLHLQKSLDGLVNLISLTKVL